MVAMNHITELSRRIAEEYHPEKIILFGSHAYGAPKEYSDVDLLVIMPFEGHPFDKATEILSRVPHQGYIDLIVRRPEDASRPPHERDFILGVALERGKVIYAREG